MSHRRSSSASIVFACRQLIAGAIALKRLWLPSAGILFALLAGPVRADSSAFKVLHSFTGQADGRDPEGPLALGPDGSVFGTTRTDDNFYAGTIYRLTLGGSLTPVHGFDSTDGSQPIGVVSAPNGILYGITRFGGPGTTSYGSGPNDDGTIFKIGLDGKFTSLYAFSSGTVGSYLNSLIVGSDGELYGAANYSNVYTERGTIFKMTPDGKVTSLFIFTDDGEGGIGNSGQYPSNLIQGIDGSLFGTSEGFNGTPFGIVFKFSLKQGFSIVHNFSSSDGIQYADALVAGSDGSLYGTSYGDSNDGSGAGTGVDYGVVFRIAADGSLSILHRFLGSDGSSPTFTGLVLARDGRLYGSTHSGGAYGNGVLYSVGIDGSDFTILHNLNSADGYSPQAPMLQVSSGAFVGTTSEGGANGKGTAFELTPSSPATTMSLISSAPSVALGKSFIVTWTSSGTTSCIASGQWSGSLSLAGMQSIVASNLGPGVYTITCAVTGGGSISRTITVTAVPDPTVTFSADTTSAVVGQTVELSWSSTNATYCNATGAWSGSVGTSGSLPVVISSTGISTFNLTCGTGRVFESSSLDVNAHPPKLTLTPISADLYALTQQCLAVYLQDAATNLSLTNIPVTFFIAGVDAGGTTQNTDSSGVTRLCLTAHSSGTDTITAHSGVASATATIKWLKRPVTMQSDGFNNISLSLNGSHIFHFNAQLTDELSGAPVVGRIVSFSVNNKLACPAITNYKGVASCQSVPGALNELVHWTYHASFAGEQVYLPASANGPLLSVTK